MKYLFSKMRDDASNITKFENNFFKYNDCSMNFFFILYFRVYKYYVTKMLIKKKVENQSFDFFECNKINIICKYI